MITFGPIPSRRLGRSLGIDNVPAKVCSYSCVYCQIGRTDRLTAVRRGYYSPEEVRAEVTDRLAQLAERGEAVDHLSFVPEGEPTLDANLGRSILALRPLGIPVAVITNGSLVDRPDVRADLLHADWVSLKVDGGTTPYWRAVDRPHGALRLPEIRKGMLRFAAEFGGTLVTETMLVAGVNDGEASLRAVAALLAELRPSVAYVLVPVRPPAESWVEAPAEPALGLARSILAESVERVELVTGFEPEALACTGDAADDLLRAAAVHPVRAAAARELLALGGLEWSVAERLIAEGRLAEVEYGGNPFLITRRWR
jgi:wyosine [tRNA(Phe)-imidazoG37] synthetase (radical SAM superfamily)